MTPGLLALRERSRALDTAWLAALSVALALVGVPWFVRAVDLALAPILWTAFAYAAVHFAAAAAAERLKTRRAVAIAIGSTRASMVVLLAVLWHLAGGLDNPVLLFAFLIPAVAGGVLLARGEALATAGASLAAVGLVATMESPELRWYLLHLGVPLGQVFDLLPNGLPGRPEPFPGMATGPAFQVTLLLAFGLVLMAAPLLAELAAREALRVSARRQMGQGARAEVEGLLQAVLRADPIPTILVYADTAQVVEASRSFVNQMLLRPEDLQGKTLFELLAFSDPQAVRGLVSSGSGELPFCAYRIGEEARVARIRSHRVRVGGDDYACLSVLDQNELFHLQKALDGLDDALLVIRDGREIAYFNGAAARLFSGLHFGMEATGLLEVPGEPPDWWSTSQGREREVRAQLRGRSFQVRSVAAFPPGAAQPITLLRLRDTDRAAAPAAVVH